MEEAEFKAGTRVLGLSYLDAVLGIYSSALDNLVKHSIYGESYPPDL